jgi:hypothetical protein
MACAPVFAGDVLPIPPSGVIGTDDAMLSPEYWVAPLLVDEKLSYAAAMTSLVSIRP